MIELNQSEKQNILTHENGSRGTISSRSIATDESVKKKGLTVISATMLVMGEMAGSGVLALPYAVEKTGHVGIFLIPVIGMTCAFTGTVLGWCWMMVQNSHEQYRGHVRRPYPVIGQTAFGNCASSLVSAFMDISLFGAGVVLLILASQNIQDLLGNLFNVHISYCYLLLIVTAAMLSLTWLGTPKDFWIIGIGAASSTLTACLILLYVETQDSLGPFRDVSVHHSTIEPLAFFEGVAVIFYSFGGHGTFPTIQNDMKEPSRFGVVACLAAIVCTLMYLALAVPAFYIYGDSLQPNVTLTMSPGPMLYVVQILITGHILCAFIIIINPMAQELEELIKIKKQFSWTRIATRTSMTAAMLFVAETVPRFGALLSLIGGSSLIMMTMIFPSAFYLKLRVATDPAPLHVVVAMIEMIVVGIFIMALSTFGSLKTIIAPHTFTWPCYVNLTSADERSRS